MMRKEKEWMRRGVSVEKGVKMRMRMKRKLMWRGSVEKKSAKIKGEDEKVMDVEE